MKSPTATSGIFLLFFCQKKRVIPFWHDLGIGDHNIKMIVMKKIYLLAVIALKSQMSFGAELFVRVLRQGTHAATAYNQTQTSSTNIFRFFDLPAGNTFIQITDQQYGSSIYTGSVNAGWNQRVVAEIDQFGVFKIIQTVNITSSNWYTSTPDVVVTNPPYGGGNYGGGYYNDGSNTPAFLQLIEMLESENFDSNRMDMAKSYADKTQLSAQQIANINKTFGYDSSKLDWAKYAYDKCYDPQNYFLLKSTFDFSSSYSALEDHIAGQ
ncbi:MAG: hypothetical protein A3D31_18710 [Candidatus Fluviicola riflensis]|nr:MAG: hypothetical protein CHH17_03450 [Candidatus Fluviicola riflensis]OGS76479.1 MAG: hypothetical protein A3D31_18710 [Candidatus Fluviicola riflensis]OGS82773.1 MAG: hypothetical protein A2724_13535 [Fluviicola sp. RIFCSPHIGHO2_01_FULL_43_53]OGS89072.1 MAG: hypothetical protein A3E30_17195 [Fluviicola sp. RIFCSPHIGHO2_12_FULL_43_24]